MNKGLEAIENANPSEALEDLKELHELAYGNDKTSWKIDEIRMSSHIKQALLKAQEQEKVLEVIKGKIIWVENDKLMCGRYADIEIELEEEDFENKEEFDLLKRYCK